MASSYSRYLRCFCGSENLAVYGFEKGGFKPVDPGQKTLETGLLVCGGCHRAYPINGRVLYMLPETLPDQAAESFFKKHSGRLPQGIRIPRFGQAVDNAADSASQSKKNEMKARDEQADKYHSFLQQTYAANEQKVFNEFLQPASGDVIVELGCGTGKITREIIKAGFKDLIAMDFSEASIRLLLEKLDGRAREKVLFIKADVCNLPLKDGIADKCASAQVFEHIPGRDEQRKFMTGLKRVLKPGGSAALTVYNLNIVKRLQKAEKGYHSGSIYFENFRKSEIRAFFREQFRIEKLSGINCYFPFFYKTGPAFQRAIESFLSRSPLNSVLGNILFLGLRL
jgi:ubiquinone/menaquinone biosynthesis C-methylase UbiE/uncharacterized protein YbaR (Trm112 family)